MMKRIRVARWLLDKLLGALLVSVGVMYLPSVTQGFQALYVFVSVSTMISGVVAYLLVKPPG